MRPLARAYRGAVLAHREIELIGSSIRNGRIYFPSTDVKFFPSNSFADRERVGHKGKSVSFQVGGRNIETDIRISSGQRISPRKSFGLYLRQVGAKEGAHLRVTRIADRECSVEYLP